MSTNYLTAPYRPAYARDANGMYYRIGGGGGGSGGGAVFVGLLASNPSPADFSQWVVTDNPAAYALRVSDGTTWYPIAGGGGGGVVGERPTAAFTQTQHWSDVSVNATTSSDPDGFITAYDWDWGDGTTHGTGALTSHTYATSGSYLIALTVTDNDDNVAQTQRTVTVTRMYGPVTFVTTMATFTPKLWQALDTPNQIEWLNNGPVSDPGSVLATGSNPTITFGSVADRTVRMYCTHPQDVLTLNVGFDILDDWSEFSPGEYNDTTYNHTPQRVKSVTGLGILTNLVHFMAARQETLNSALDFTGLSKLTHIECAYSDVTNVILTGCTSLIRFCLEENRITNGQVLDLNPVGGTLRDVRAAVQDQNVGLILAPLTRNLDQLVHLCVRDQPVTNMPTHLQMPELRELWIWNTHQTGRLDVGSKMVSLRAAGSGHSILDLSRTSGIGGECIANSNPWTSVIGLDTGRHWNGMQFQYCSFTQSVVNGILATVNAWGSTNGMLDLSGNASPTGGQNNTDRLALVSRGWQVLVA